MKYQLLERNNRNTVEEGSSEQKMTNFLETISEPGDVQHLNLDQLESLAEECRQRIIEVTSKQINEFVKAALAEENRWVLHPDEQTSIVETLQSINALYQEPVSYTHLTLPTKA